MTPGPRRQLSWWQDGEKRPRFHLFPEPQCSLLNEGLGAPSPPGARGLAVQPLLRPAFWNWTAPGLLWLWLPSLSPESHVDFDPPG